MAPTTPPTTPPMIFLLELDSPDEPPELPPETRPGVDVTVAKPVVLATTLDETEVMDTTLPSLVVT